ncbi:MAG: LysR family transcriptional regulator, partial [Peptococcaceae bacterium]|nr:LysR family transcriptional regulator [Peptococcaceae bacterium]
MHMNQLSYFLHVAETGSINAAAQNFFISQQAINTQIKKLEDE